MGILTDETIRKLFQANQEAINQLGRDIVILDKKIVKKTLITQSNVETLRRDLKDRWQYLSDITKTFEKAINDYGLPPKTYKDCGTITRDCDKCGIKKRCLCFEEGGKSVIMCQMCINKQDKKVSKRQKIAGEKERIQGDVLDPFHI